MFELDWHSTINQSNLKTSYWHSDWCGRNRDFFYIRSIGRKRRKNITLLSTGGHGKKCSIYCKLPRSANDCTMIICRKLCWISKPKFWKPSPNVIEKFKAEHHWILSGTFFNIRWQKERPTAQWDTCHNQSISSLTNWYVIRSNNPLSQNAWRHLGKTWLRRWRYGHISHE
jgi:hypothetical protein